MTREAYPELVEQFHTAVADCEDKLAAYKADSADAGKRAAYYDAVRVCYLAEGRLNQAFTGHKDPGREK